MFRYPPVISYIAIENSLPSRNSWFSHSTNGGSFQFAHVDQAGSVASGATWFSPRPPPALAVGPEHLEEIFVSLPGPDVGLQAAHLTRRRDGSFPSQAGMMCRALRMDTLWLCQTWLLNMAIEIVSFPMKNGGSFHSYVNVYQRVDDLGGTTNFRKPPYVFWLNMIFYGTSTKEDGWELGVPPLS